MQRRARRPRGVRRRGPRRRPDRTCCCSAWAGRASRPRSSAAASAARATAWSSHVLDTHRRRRGARGRAAVDLDHTLFVVSTQVRRHDRDAQPLQALLGADRRAAATGSSRSPIPARRSRQLATERGFRRVVPRRPRHRRALQRAQPLRASSRRRCMGADVEALLDGAQVAARGLPRRRPGRAQQRACGSARRSASSRCNGPRQADVRRRRRGDRERRPVARAARRRVDRQARARASCPSPTSRSARRRPTATTASSSTCKRRRLEARRAGRRARARRPPGADDPDAGREGPRPDLLLRRVRHRGRRLGAGAQPVRPAQRPGGQGQHQAGARRRRCPTSRAGAPDDVLGAAAAPPTYVAIMAYVAAERRRSTTQVAELRRAIRDDTQGDDDVRLRPALPALDRPVPQGRPADRRCSCSSSTTSRTTSRSRARTYSFEQLKQAQAAGDLPDAASARPARSCRVPAASELG